MFDALAAVLEQLRAIAEINSTVQLGVGLNQGGRQRGGNSATSMRRMLSLGRSPSTPRENISEDVDVLMTDDYGAYRSASNPLRKIRKHKTIKHKLKIYIKGDIHTNTVESTFSLLKCGIVGTWHRISAKHLQAYCTEMAFRCNRRKNSDLFVDTPRHMITAPVLTFERLTA